MVHRSMILSPARTVHGVCHSSLSTGALEETVGDFQVTCIHKRDRMSSHEHITHIGNVDGGWCLTRESAIQRIDSGQDAFYTVDRATRRRIAIGVYRQTGRVPYLRTYADGKWNDNLLAQPECPTSCREIE